MVRIPIHEIKILAGITLLCGNVEYSVLYIPKAPALTTIPESNAEIVEGAEL